jgi:hypothetical protein
MSKTRGARRRRDRPGRLDRLPPEVWRAVSLQGGWDARTVRRARRCCRSASQALEQLHGAGPATLRRWVLNALVAGCAEAVARMLRPLGPAGEPWRELADRCRGVSGEAGVLAAATRHLECRLLHDAGAVVLATDAARVGDLGWLPDLESLEIGPCPNLLELPTLPRRCTMLLVHDCPALTRIDVAPPGGLTTLEVTRCDRLVELTTRFLDRAATSYNLSGNRSLRDIGAFRQRPRRGRAAAGFVHVSENAMLRRLPPGFASRMRLALLSVDSNDRLEETPERFGWAARVQRLEVTHNPALTAVRAGFLERGSCDRLKLTHNELLEALPPAPRFRVVGKMTVGTSDRLEELPAGLGGDACVIRHLKVTTNTVLRVLWREPAAFSGVLEVTNNFSLTMLAPRLTFAATGGLIVSNNTVLRTLATQIDGRLEGAFQIDTNALLSDLAPDGVQLGRCVRSITVADNPALRRLPRGLLHDCRVEGDVLVQGNDSLRSLGPYCGCKLLVGGRLLVRNNPRLDALCLGPGLAVGAAIEVAHNAQLHSLRVAPGTRVVGALTVQGNARLRRLAIGGAPVASVGHVWVAENPHLEVGLAESTGLDAAGLAFVGNPRLRALAPPDGVFHGCVGTLTVTDNPCLRSVPTTMLRAAHVGLVLARNRALKSLPGGWADGGRVFSGAVRVLHNHALVRIDHRDLAIQAEAIEIRGNAALEEVAPGDVTLSCEDDMHVSDNAALVRVGGGAVSIVVGGDLTIARNPRLYELSAVSVQAYADGDLSVELCPSVKRLAPRLATLVAGESLVLHAVGCYQPIDMYAADRPDDTGIRFVDTPV